MRETFPGDAQSSRSRTAMSRPRIGSEIPTNQVSQRRAMTGMGIAPDTQRRIVRSSRLRTRSAKRRRDIPDASMREDWEQFAQLIGYSVSGFGTLRYVSDKAFAAAMKAETKLPSGDPRG